MYLITEGSPVGGTGEKCIPIMSLRLINILYISHL